MVVIMVRWFNHDVIIYFRAAEDRAREARNQRMLWPVPAEHALS